MSDRQQISATISPDTYNKLEQISIRTGLSRSRLLDLALDKFITWCALVDDVQIRQISHDMTPALGYARRDSGFRRESSAPRSGARPAPGSGEHRVANPYTPPQKAAPAPPQPGLRKTAGGKK